MKYTRSQHVFANIKINKAKETDLSLSLIPIPQKERIQIIVINYCQKLNVPHLGADQLDDVYHSSPKLIYCFGICNSVTNHLTAYMYDKSEQFKGGNNVASLLVDYVQQNFVYDGEAPMKEFNIIMDICAGQNKNRVVICLAVCMMETGMFSKVNLILLIKGQTKIMCNCMFNTMKWNYAKQNAYTKEETY